MHWRRSYKRAPLSEKSDLSAETFNSRPASITKVASWHRIPCDFLICHVPARAERGVLVGARSITAWAGAAKLLADLPAACFGADAKVLDEGQDYVGKDAVRRWKELTVAKYGISIAPLNLSERNGRVIVVTSVAGNFPGSPADLTYSFGLSPEGVIRTLEIH